MQTFDELPAGIEYFFTDPADYDAKGVKKQLKFDWLADRLQVLQEELNTTDKFIAPGLDDKIRALAENWEISAAGLIHPLLLALTGGTSSPGLFELMEILGRDKVVRRVNSLISFLQTRTDSSL